ncbi:MAG: amidohydrolase family protein [Clostridia bacterium]|nr:amidohydrolase family protein [Clostridia bacterium]
MVIDFHNHFYPDKIAQKAIDKLSTDADIIAYTDGTLQGLSDDIKNAGYDLGVVLPVATAPKQVEGINTRAIQVQEQFPNLISFAAMHPDYENYKDEIFRIKELGLKGIKFHPDYQATFFDDDKMLRILDEAFKNDLIVVVHAGIDIGLPNPVHTGIEQILNVLDIFKDRAQKLVLAHTGGWGLWDEVYEKIAGRNVYMDISFSLGTTIKKSNGKIQKLIEDDMLMKIVKKHGVDKILYGTDSPWGDHKMMLDKFMTLPFTKEEQDKILYQNAKKLLKI